MRRCLTAILVVGLVSVNTRDAAAQSSKDISAAAALGVSPVGALTPIMVSPGTKGEKSFDNLSGRYAHFAPASGGLSSNAFGASYYHSAGMNAAVSVTAGMIMPSCPSGATCNSVTTLGADVHSSLWASAPAKGSTTGTSINMQGSLGYGTNKNGNGMSLAVGIPLALSMDQADKSRFSAFVTPGFGWGRFSPKGGTAESGTRPLVGAGASWTSAAGWGLHAGYQKIVISNGGNSIGAGFSWKL